MFKKHIIEKNLKNINIDYLLEVDKNGNIYDKKSKKIVLKAQEYKTEDSFIKAFENLSIKYGHYSAINQINKYIFLYNSKRKLWEYQLGFFIKTLRILKNIKKKKDKKYTNGEFKILLQEYENEYIQIEGFVSDVIVDKQGYIKKICLVSPEITGKTTKIEELKNIYKSKKDKINKKEKLSQKYVKNINPRVFASHIWIELKDFINIEELYLTSYFKVFGKVSNYKGIIHNSKVKTTKYGLEDCFIASQLALFPKTNIYGDSKETFIDRAGNKKIIREKNDSTDFSLEIRNWPKEEAIGIKDFTGKLKFNKKSFDFYTKDLFKKNNILTEKEFHLLNKYERLGFTYGIRKKDDYKDVNW